MKSQSSVLGSVLLVLCGVAGCSAGAAPGSKPNSGAAGTAGSSASGEPATGAGAEGPIINTTSGMMTDVDGGNGCGSTLDVTYRDFDVGGDFEGPFAGDVVRRGLVQAMLGSDQKPVFNDSVGHPAKAGTPVAIDETWSVTQPVIQSAASFKPWYNTTPGVNQEFAKKLKLEEGTPGTGIFSYESSAFFPLAPTEGFGITPKNNDLGMNFLFTTEIHMSFTYHLAQQFSFRGDDDLWIFVNGKLALDLGSMHGPEAGTIDFDTQAASLGIAVGSVYSMDVFHAERHMRGSNFKITTNIGCFTPGFVK